MNERKQTDRRKIERRAGKPGVNVRIEDKNPDDVKRVRRGAHDKKTKKETQ